MKKLIIVLLCFSVLISCKSEEKPPLSNSVEVEKKPDKLKFMMEFSSDTDDKLQMLFAQIELRNGRNAMYLIDENIKSSEDFNEIGFEMYDDLIPYVVQLKLGDSPKSLKINQIVLSYEDREVVVNGQDIDKYFALNDYVEYDATSKTIKTKTISGKHLPHMSIRRGFIKRLFKLQ